MKYSYLLFLSGNDIPFPAAGITIHAPTIKEIGLIGEDNFFMGCNLINFEKDQFLSEQDKDELGNVTNFDILMSILNNTFDQTLQNGKESILMLLALLFPDRKIEFINNKIQLKSEDEQICNYIDNNNFELFKNILTQMFCLKSDKSEVYNPSGSLAKKIADKLKRDQQKRAQITSAANKGKQISILDTYVSILAIGEQKDMNQLLNYTVYQLYNEFERFQLKEKFEMYARAALAGAKMDKEPVNWMIDMHSQEYEDIKKDS